jgi:hypothetical protein
MRWYDEELSLQATDALTGGRVRTVALATGPGDVHSLSPPDIGKQFGISWGFPQSRRIPYPVLRQKNTYSITERIAGLAMTRLDT